MNRTNKICTLRGVFGLNGGEEFAPNPLWSVRA
jgi:hypothetical protein